MAGFRDFAFEFRRREDDYSDVTDDHVALYALKNNRLILINDDEKLANFQAHDIWVGTQEEQREANLFIHGSQEISGAIDGSNLVFDPDGVNPWCIDNYGTPSLSGSFLDYMLRFTECKTGFSWMSIRSRLGSVVIGNFADQIEATGHSLQVNGDAFIDGDLTVTGEIDPSTDGGFAGSRTMIDFDASQATVNVSGWTEPIGDNDISSFYSDDGNKSAWEKETYLSEDVISLTQNYVSSIPSQMRSFDIILQDLERRKIPFDRATKAIVAEFDMAFSIVNNSGQNGRTGFVLVRDYPSDPLDFDNLFEIDIDAVGQPAYGLFIRNKNNVPGPPYQHSLFYGGIGSNHFYQIFNLGDGIQWLPSPRLSDGGEPGNISNGSDTTNQYISVDNGNIWGDNQFHKVKWVIEPFRQRYYFDGELLLEQSLPETSDTKFNYAYFDKIDALRIWTLEEKLKLKNVQVRFVTDHPLVETQRSTQDHYVSNHGDYYLSVDSTSGSYTVFMNAYPLAGDRIIIHDEGKNVATNPVTIDGNGYDIDGSSSYQFSTEAGTLILLFNGVQYEILQKTTNRNAISGVTGWYYADRGGEQYVGVDVTSSVSVVVLPQDPDVGDKYIIKDEEGNASSNSITISGGIHDIDNFGSSTDITIDEASYTAIFSDGKWRLI